MPQVSPTHPHEQFLEQDFQVLWLPAMERHQGIHEAMLQQTQGCWRVNAVPTSLELQESCDLQPLAASTRLAARQAFKVKCAQQAHDGQQECSGRQALEGSPQAVATACLKVSMHWQTPHRLQVHIPWQPPCTQKTTKGIVCRMLRC